MRVTNSAHLFVLDLIALQEICFVVPEYGRGWVVFIISIVVMD